MTSQRIGKYACLEVECRYLLEKIPDGLPDHPDGWLITDRYLPHTRMRLRHMQSIAGNGNIYKLTQKYRAETQNAYEATVTNQYLTETEYRLFESLEAKILRKKRYPFTVQDQRFGIDVFEGRHQGLILAEREMEKTGEMGLVLPSFALKEVTDDPFFTGGNLVAISDEAFRRGLLGKLRGQANS